MGKVWTKGAVWTEARIARAKQLWCDGVAPREIAAELGCFGHCGDGGRSAIIGRMHRLGLSSPRRRAAPRPRVHIKPRPTEAKPLVPPRPPKPEPPPRPILAARWVAFAELADRGECHWPGDGGKFCGASTMTAHGSYCAAHVEAAKRSSDAA